MSMYDNVIKKLLEAEVIDLLEILEIKNPKSNNVDNNKPAYYFQNNQLKIALPGLSKEELDSLAIEYNEPEIKVSLNSELYGKDFQFAIWNKNFEDYVFQNEYSYENGMIVFNCKLKEGKQIKFVFTKKE